MKNMKVAKKLILSFLVVAILAAAVGVVSIYGMYSMNKADDGLYNGNYLPTVLAGDISQIISNQRILIRDFVIYDVNEDAEHFLKSENSLADLIKTMQQYFKDYDITIVNDEDREAFDEFVKVYNNEWMPTVSGIHDLGAANLTQEAKSALDAAGVVADRMSVLAATLQSVNLADGKKAVDGNTKLFQTMTIIEVIVLVVAVACALFFAVYISRLISKPLTVMTEYLKKVSTTGDMTLTAADQANIAQYSTMRDETGQCVAATAAFITRLLEIGKVQEMIAGGDLTGEISLLSPADTMGHSLSKMMENLNNMFSEIHTSSAQVSTGSKQIADGAQSLAQGSTEQAAAVQQFSASISEIASKTKHNAAIAREAAALSDTIKQNAEKGSQQMGNMMQAVKEINEASNEIEKVIKVIDEIAFQTNILALNAAVEAARAGSAGKGFAVVAAEVRNLAAKSADAAKDTGGLIENSVQKANLGLDIATETSVSLRDIVEGINRSADIIGQIAQSSDEQAEAVAQVNIGIDQVAQVIQQNSATAEQSAAASEEMSGQSDMLEHLISQFKIREAEYSMPSMISAPKSYDAPAKRSYSAPAYSGGDSFGKY